MFPRLCNPAPDTSLSLVALFDSRFLLRKGGIRRPHHLHETPLVVKTKMHTKAPLKRILKVSLEDLLVNGWLEESDRAPGNSSTGNFCHSCTTVEENLVWKLARYKYHREVYRRHSNFLNSRFQIFPVKFLQRIRIL